MGYSWMFALAGQERSIMPEYLLVHPCIVKEIRVHFSQTGHGISVELRYENIIYLCAHVLV